MLVLQRKENEWISISPHIEVRILQVAGEQVKIGIKAPKDIRILRGELQEKVMQANESAVESAEPDVGVIRRIRDKFTNSDLSDLRSE